MTTTTRMITLGITGMTCGSCERRVENALTAVPGVHDASVDLARSMATIRYDPASASPVALTTAVRTAGYDIQAPGQVPAPGPGGGGCCCG